MRRTGTRTAALAIGVAAVLLAGCSSGGDAGSEQAEAAAATTSTPAPATTATLPPPLADQTPPDQANGIDVDGATVWVTDFDTGTIVQVDRETGAILTRVDAGSASADDVAVAPDGSLWSSGIVSGELGRTVDGRLTVATYLLSNVTGKLFRVDIEAGAAELVATVTEGLPFDNLAFADDGTLYFSSFATASLTERSPDGTVRTIPLGT